MERLKIQKLTLPVYALYLLVSTCDILLSLTIKREGEGAGVYSSLLRIAVAAVVIV